MNRSGWTIFAAITLILAGLMRVVDAIWAFQYHGTLPDGLRGALGGTSMATYGWIWLVVGIILMVAGIAVLAPGDTPSSEVGSWVGIVAAGIGAVTALFLMPYYPAWSLLYVLLGVLVIYGLSVNLTTSPTYGRRV